MNENQIVIYQTDDGQTQIDVRLENDTVWLTQAQMADLFQTDRTSIVRHVNNIYKVEELDKESTCAKKAQVQIEGKRTVKRIVPFYNLDMIISVGYRVNSKRGVKFRQWANHVLKDYLVKGYAINDRIRREQISELKGWQCAAASANMIDGIPTISSLTRRARSSTAPSAASPCIANYRKSLANNEKGSFDGRFRHDDSNERLGAENPYSRQGRHHVLPCR